MGSFPRYQPPAKPKGDQINIRLVSVTSGLLEACKTAVADAATATNPVARLPNYEQMATAISKAELAIAIITEEKRT